MAAGSRAAFPSTHPVAASRKASTAAATQPSRFGMILMPQAGRAVSGNVLVALAATMKEPRGGALTDPPGASATNSLPAGYTYLGQFFDHDLTFDKRLFSKKVGPTGTIRNLRTPRFDLDSLYGGGPQGDTKALYERDRIRLKVDNHDLRRRPDGSAYINDRRNDSNRILSQLHLALARFHNRVASRIGNTSTTFDQAREVVTRHYQWIALHDFIERLVGKKLVQSILQGGPAKAARKLKLFPKSPDPKIPFEFSAAAFRFGHSMVRAAYALNPTSGLMLTFDGLNPAGHLGDDLRGFRPLPKELAIDWDFFFRVPGGNPAVLQLARPINTLIAGPLFEMPNQVAQNKTAQGRRLPFRNLHRGELDIRLASGQQLALFMRSRVPGAGRMKILGLRGVPMAIVPGQLTGVDESPTNLGGTGIGIATLQAHFQGRTPLWYYILKEAAQLGNGRTLGPLGGRLVAEVFVSLLLSDRNSILGAGSRWRPSKGQYGCRQNDKYTIADLLSYASGKGPT